MYRALDPASFIGFRFSDSPPKGGLRAQPTAALFPLLFAFAPAGHETLAIPSTFASPNVPLLEFRLLFPISQMKSFFSMLAFILSPFLLRN